MPKRVRNVHRSEEPQSRLQRICEHMLAAAQAHPEWSDDISAAVMLDTDERAGTAYHVESDAAAFELVLRHLEALGAVHGVTVNAVFPAAN